MIPLSLHGYVEPAGSGADYVFELRVVAPVAGTVDGIVFGDVGTGAPAGAETLANPVLIGPAPAPYTALGTAGGSHEGPSFENHPAAGWTPTGVGDTLAWAVHADALVPVSSLYFSTMRGDVRLDYVRIVDDCTLAATTPAATLHEGVCAGLEQVCAPDTLRFVDPDYEAIDGYEPVEASCDDRDNDCNGAVDDVPDPPVADRQDGVCAGALRVCADRAWVEPEYAAIAGYEDVEAACDGLDNDCDGAVDEDLAAPPGDRAAGVCEDAVKVCAGSDGWQEPDYAALVDYEARESRCEGLDNDCNGEVDDAIECARLEGGCGCAAESAMPGVWTVLLACGALRRRWGTRAAAR